MTIPGNDHGTTCAKDQVVVDCEQTAPKSLDHLSNHDFSLVIFLGYTLWYSGTLFSLVLFRG